MTTPRMVSLRRYHCRCNGCCFHRCCRCCFRPMKNFPTAFGASLHSMSCLVPRCTPPLVLGFRCIRPHLQWACLKEFSCLVSRCTRLFLAKFVFMFGASLHSSAFRGLAAVLFIFGPRCTRPHHCGASLHLSTFGAPLHSSVSFLGGLAKLVFMFGASLHSSASSWSSLHSSSCWGLAAFVRIWGSSALVRLFLGVWLSSFSRLVPRCTRPH